MRAINIFALALLLSFSGSGATAAFSPQTSEVREDDDDQSVMQAEVTGQIEVFLQRLHSHWGMNQDAIRGRVTGLLAREDSGTLVFARHVADHDVLEGYDFREGSLVRGQYVFLQQPVNGLNEFIDCYAAVKHSLSTRYGAPAQDDTIWNNDLYQPLPDYWGVAVQIGHLRYAATWETADGTITIELTGNHHSRLMIEYRCRGLADRPQAA
jgi:hypothetical protein